jgi:peptide/nickel transport system permease protein
MAGLCSVAFLFVVSLLAPVLANDKPVVYIEDGRWYFPALFRYKELARMEWKWGALRDGPRPANIRALFPPVPYGPDEQSLYEGLRPPSAKHPFGTDALGSDVLSRMIHGTGVALQIGFVSMGIAALIGILLGALAGYYGRWTDIVISRLIEVMMCFPTIFLILTIIAYLRPSLYNVMAAIGLTQWTGIARYTRGEFLRLKEEDFAEAARAIGAKDRRIIFRHILPNSLAPVLVNISFGIASAILIEAGLSFLGFGPPPPAATWGQILATAWTYVGKSWWLTIFPGMAIFFSVMAYNLVGDGLRDALDPRTLDRSLVFPTSRRKPSAKL